VTKHDSKQSTGTPTGSKEVFGGAAAIADSEKAASDIEDTMSDVKNGASDAKKTASHSYFATFRKVGTAAFQATYATLTGKQAAGEMVSGQRLPAVPHR